MPEETFSESFANFLKNLRQFNIKAPASIQLTDKDEALRIIWEINKEDLIPVGGAHRLLGSTPYESIADKVRSGEMQSFLLYGIEFWWKSSGPALEVQQGLRAA